MLMHIQVRALRQALLLVVLAAMAPRAAAVDAPTQGYAARPDVQTFIADLAAVRHLVQ